MYILLNTNLKINSFICICFSFNYVIYTLCYVILCYTPVRAYAIFGILNKPFISGVHMSLLFNSLLLKVLLDILIQKTCTNIIVGI